MPMTDEEAALKAIATLDSLSDEQRDAKSQIDSMLSSKDPFIDIHKLFSLYNILYFCSLLLPRVEVSWSTRLTLCAGICELVRDPNNDNKYTKIRLKLSEPLLRYRPRSDVLNTLLHESIHAYFFITMSWLHSRGDDRSGHGPGFLLLADAINSHGGYEITVLHNFQDEVDKYRTHVWQCDGPCLKEPPLFGLVKRSMNRAPGKGDLWWAEHEQLCGGAFKKIAAPELTKAQVQRLTLKERAGRQSNKIDLWATKKDDAPSPGVEGSGVKRARSSSVEEGAAKRVRELVTCPICNEEVAPETINEHLDTEHPP